MISSGIKISVSVLALTALTACGGGTTGGGGGGGGGGPLSETFDENVDRIVNEGATLAPITGSATYVGEIFVDDSAENTELTADLNLTIDFGAGISNGTTDNPWSGTITNMVGVDDEGEFNVAGTLNAVNGTANFISATTVTVLTEDVTTTEMSVPFEGTLQDPDGGDLDLDLAIAGTFFGDNGAGASGTGSANIDPVGAEPAFVLPIEFYMDRQ